MKRILTLHAALLLAPLAALHAADFVLADKSQSIAPAPIIVFKDAPPRTHDAAVTLADYIGKVTGVKPAVIDGEPKPAPERAIWIGVQPVVKSLFPKTDFDFKHPEETLIAANENHLVIAGRDRWDPAHMEAKGRLAMKTNMQQEYGTANAVYTFIQDKLGVRWLWPDEEDVIKQEKIAIAPCELRYHPQIRARSGLWQAWAVGQKKEGPQQGWARYQRVQLDSLELIGGSAFTDWWNKYHVKHPDYFALQPDGSRDAGRQPIYAKLCESNPAVWEQWLANVDEELKADPTRRVFNASENDGYAYGHCVCEKCRAKDNPAAEKFPFSWKGKNEERPALSDRQVIFANTLARLLKQRYPGRELYVQLGAYGCSRPAPVAAVPDDNVIISSVANFHLRGDGGGEYRTKFMQDFAAWSKVAAHLEWRPNIGSPAGLLWGMPDVAMTQATEDFRFVADHHCMGVFFDHLCGFWATQGPHDYLVAQLAWNPHADAQAIMGDYYQRAFGPAAAELKGYWTLLEQARMSFVKEEPNRYCIYDIPKKYTPELLARAQSFLDAADGKAAGADSKYRRRLAFVRCGFDYTKLVVETRAAMQKFEKSSGKDAEARAVVLAHWDTAAKMKQTFPALAIDWQTVFRESSGAKESKKGKKDKSAARAMGLHPDNPLSGKNLRLLQSTTGVE